MNSDTVILGTVKYFSKHRANYTETRVYSPDLERLVF